MAGRDLTQVLLGFAGALRRAGLPASHQRVTTMLAAVDALGAAEAAGVYWAGRLTVCADPDDLARYDIEFARYFGTGARPPPAGSTPAATGRLVATFGGGAGRGAAADDALAVAASDIDLLRRRDLAGLSDAERAEVGRLLALLAPATPTRPGRRHRPARRGRIDPARTVRAMLRDGGEPTRLARRARRPRPRRLVLLIDVSGSMSPYADALLRFAHAAVRCRPTRTEVFTVGTRLTRVTRQLRAADPEVALAACGRAVPDWSGGTRLGETIRAFLDRWGQRGTARQAVVVIASDGWERGDPALLGDQLARLSRLAHRIIWVNPHRGRPGYRPVTGGMVAALPHLDSLVAGHSFAALTELVGQIGRG